MFSSQERIPTLELQQKQVQHLSHKQQQALLLLQTRREDLYSVLMDRIEANPLLQIEDYHRLVPVDARTILEDHHPLTFEGDYEQSAASIQSMSDDQWLMDSYGAPRHNSFQGYLLNQIMCYRETPIRTLMVRLIDELDENGFLRQTPTSLAEAWGCDEIMLEDALTLVKQLEPVGVGAADLRECWMLQTEQDDHAPAIAYVVLESFFECLTQRKLSHIAKALDVTESEVEEVINYLKTLSWSPKAAFDGEAIRFIIPDVFIHRTAKGYRVRYNWQDLPNVVFNQQAYNHYQETGTPEVIRYVDKMQKEFLDIQASLTRRETTLVKITNAMLIKQLSFFESKGHRLQPLTLKDIADACQLHTSTISRAVDHKYMQTDFGVYRFTDLFSQSVVESREGGGISQQDIQQRIEELIATEDKRHPYTDQALMAELHQMGITVARRTISKYRQMLGILSASQRKRR